MDRAKLRFLRPDLSIPGVGRASNPPIETATRLNTQPPLLRRRLPMAPTDISDVEANYRPGPPQGARRRCGNCVFWRMSDCQCLLHEASVIVPSHGICRAHFYGTPGPGGTGDAISTRDLEILPPERSGLCSPSGLVGCDQCGNYEIRGSTRGVCMRIVDKATMLPKVVEPFGFCSLSTQLCGRPDQS